MNRLTYKEAYDKIIEAYFKDEIKPYRAQFCFCGTLCDGNAGWSNSSTEAYYRGKPHNDFGSYSGVEYMLMERALLKPIDGDIYVENYEEALFQGMCSALEVLKQIHKERGEDVDGVQEFKKRELINRS